MSLRSALDQTVPRSEYEILLVKDFEDEVIDGLCQENGVQVVNVEGRVGAMLAAAITRARGDILIFLDDDDRFLRDKVSRVLEQFRRSEIVAYVHNRSEFIDESGNFLGRYDNACANAENIHAGTTSLWELARVVRTDGAHNLSSISVRRSALLPFLEELAMIEGATDRFMFFTCLREPMVATLDSTVLTQYRIHSSSATRIARQERDNARIIRENRRILSTLERLSHVPLPSSSRRLIELLKVSKEIKLNVLDAADVKPIQPIDICKGVLAAALLRAPENIVPLLLIPIARLRSLLASRLLMRMIAG